MEVLSCLATPAIEVIKCLIAPLGRQIGYIVCYKRNVESLREKVEELVRVRNDLELPVDGARRRGDLIKQVVEAWLARVDIIRDEVMELNVGIDEINSWFKGWCCSRYHLGKEAKTKIGIVNELLEQGRSITSSVSESAPLPGIETIPAGDFQDFASRKSTTKQVIEALKDEMINVIGVYGLGGVGKTTLMKEVGKKVKKEALFDEVVMVTVSQNPDIKRIQGEIAEILGLKCEEQTEDGRARRLSERLMKEKRVLVILDDLWSRLDLARVGIPHGDDHKGTCKVLVTTRSQDVCNQMETHAMIEVKVLSEQDSWNLFRQKAGDVVDSPDLETLAKEVAGECKCLPLAIATLGRAMRGKGQRSLWVEASRQLKHYIFKGMSPVFSSIKLSYDFLESEEIQKCFLYCCFFPEDSKISSTKLMPYVMGEELLENVYTLEEAEYRLQTVFDKLIAACLLTKVQEDENGFVTEMHDVVRDTAISSIANEEGNRFVVKAGLGLARWPDGENLRACIRMSLMYNQISKLPDEPECPQLSSFSLLGNRSLKIIPKSFFGRMTSLLILDLSWTRISSLPPTLSSLVKLQVLQLRHTLVSNVSLVGKLKKLKILGLDGTQMRRLPEEIRELTNLRSLSLSDTDLEIIPQNVLSNLTLLEELQMRNSFSAWEIDETGDRSNKAKLVELASLNCLTKLSLGVENVNCLSKDIPICTENLQDFDIRACGHYVRERQRKSMTLTTPSDPLSNWAKVLLKRTEILYLIRCRDLKNVVELDAGGFKDLKFLSLEECHEMEYFMSVVEMSSSETTFSALKNLQINRMNGLKALYQEPLPNGFLEKLEVLKVLYCPKMMTNVVPGDLMVKIQNLKEIEVFCCDELTEIFQSERQVEGHAVMPRLRKIHLMRLPKLKTIWKLVAPFSLIFPNLTNLYIHNCARLNHLFPMKLVRGLQNLRALDVVDCDGMEEIIVYEEEEVNDEEEYKKLLPQLRSLFLDRLPKLSSFSKKKLLFDWPSLEYLGVLECPNLKKLPLGAQSAPLLERFDGEDAEWFEGLEWEDQSIKSHLQLQFNPRPSYSDHDSFSSDHENQDPSQSGIEDQDPNLSLHIT